MLTALNTLPDAFTHFLGAVAQNRGFADKFTDNFNYPEKQWDLFSNPDNAGPLDRGELQRQPGVVAATPATTRTKPQQRTPEQNSPHS
jgi:hypothetical protein